MRKDSQPIAHFITSVAGIDGFSEPVQVQVIISRTTEVEEADTQKQATDLAQEGEPTPYVHSVTTSLSEANKQGLDNLAYWRNGPESSKVYIYNQALAQYKESQRPIPIKGTR